MLKTDSEDEDEASSSFDRNNVVEVTHVETFAHSGQIPVIPVTSIFIFGKSLPIPAFANSLKTTFK